MIDIELQRLPHGEGLPAPAYATEGAAGLDVVAAEDLTLAPGQRHAVATGFAIAIPDGYEVQVRPRSGLALKHGITCLNTPGTIDHDYRGEVKVILANLGIGAVRGAPRRADRSTGAGAGAEGAFREVETLGETSRGAGGFGSTGSEPLRPRTRTLCAAHRHAAGRRDGAAAAEGSENRRHRRRGNRQRGDSRAGRRGGRAC